MSTWNVLGRQPPEPSMLGLLATRPYSFDPWYRRRGQFASR